MKVEQRWRCWGGYDFLHIQITPSNVFTYWDHRRRYASYIWPYGIDARPRPNPDDLEGPKIFPWAPAARRCGRPSCSIWLSDSSSAVSSWPCWRWRCRPNVPQSRLNESEIEKCLEIFRWRLRRFIRICCSPWKFHFIPFDSRRPLPMTWSLFLGRSQPHLCIGS